MAPKELTLQGQIYALKKRLREYRDTETYLWEQIERYESLESKMLSVASPVLTDMPKNPSPSNDRFSKYVAQLDEIEREIKRVRLHQDSEKAWVLSVLRHINPSERSVILIRYIDGEEWTKVSEILFGNREDYEERKESYMRLTTRRHGRALEDMASYIYGKENPQEAQKGPQEILSELLDTSPTMI